MSDVTRVEIVKQKAPPPRTNAFWLVVNLFALWAWLYGVSTPWGRVHIDLLPPALRVDGVADVRS